ncbi:MMPL family transporter [Vibrio sp. WXL103]|uniref:MMPL family transporter n=1 Tax=Vibrio sp. WXL103 TaxID=3450710 RepID=UPI003EC4F6CE
MRDTMLRRTWLLILLVAIGFAGSKLAGGQSVQTSLFAMFPSQTQTPALDIALEHASAVFEHDLIVMLDGKNAQDTLNAANQLANDLEQIDGIHLISSKQRSEFIKHLFDYRQQLMTEQDRATIADGASANLTQATLRRLYSPAGLNGQSFIHDPWQTFERYLLAQIDHSEFSYQDGFLIAHQEERTQILLQLHLKPSAFSSDAIEGINQLNSLVQGLEGRSGLDVYRTGAGFYSASAMDLAKTEISVIGGGALLLVIAVVMWLFAHPKPLAMTLLSLGSGVVCGLAMTLLCFGEVHVLALVMGSSLIGLSFDYSFHYLSYLACQSHQQSNQSLIRHLRPALMLGMLSSIVAYSCLFWAKLPVLNQMALFSVFGLVGALASVLLLYPQIKSFPASLRTQRVATTLSQSVSRWVGSKGLLILVGVYLLIAIRALMVGHANDDVRLLQSPDAQLVFEEKLIKQRLNSQGGSDWVITLGYSAERVALQEEALTEKLELWIAQDKLTSYMAATQWVPSVERQKHNWQAYQALLDQQGGSLVEAVGMTSAPASNEFKPLLSIQSESDLGLPKLAGQLDDGRYFSLLLLSGLKAQFDPQLLSPNQHYINYVNDIGALLGDYRQRVAKLLFWAVAAVVSVMAIYFGPRRCLRLMVSPILALVIAAALPAALGMPITLFHVLGLFLIFGIGIDYSVFLMCHGRSPHTILAVFVAGISSLLSFGLMSLSSNYAIASFGITVGLGVLSSWLIAPLVLLRGKGND